MNNFFKTFSNFINRKSLKIKVFLILRNYWHFQNEIFNIKSITFFHYYLSKNMTNISSDFKYYYQSFIMKKKNEISW